MKTCFKCNRVLPISEFYKHPAMKDGVLGKCKTCVKAYVKARRFGESRQKILEQDKEKSKKQDKVKKAERQRKYRTMYPERNRAKARIAYAISVGKLQPWPVCALPDCDKPPEAHHADYSRALDVIWLCSEHHHQAHALLANTEPF